MPTETNIPEQEKFVPGQNYVFDPPVETNCIIIGRNEWLKKCFAEGWCLKYEPARDAFIFQGKPIAGSKDAGLEHYFSVQWGKGSVAEKVPPPTLHLVK